jgi:YidC/Oxa1 family membrane protein insertase
MKDCRQFESDRFRIQSDFGSTIHGYTSDLLSQNWSSIAYEFSFATLKPSLFVNTPRKIINQDYQIAKLMTHQRFTYVMRLDNQLPPECIEKELLSLTEELVAMPKNYVTLISEARSRNISNIGHAADIAQTISLINQKKGSKNGLLG